METKKVIDIKKEKLAYAIKNDLSPYKIKRLKESIKRHERQEYKKRKRIRMIKKIVRRYE